jgi:hypothetical protein
VRPEREACRRASRPGFPDQADKAAHGLAKCVPLQAVGRRAIRKCNVERAPNRTGKSYRRPRNSFKGPAIAAASQWGELPHTDLEASSATRLTVAPHIWHPNRRPRSFRLPPRTPLRGCSRAPRTWYNLSKRFAVRSSCLASPAGDRHVVHRGSILLALSCCSTVVGCRTGFCLGRETTPKPRLTRMESRHCRPY